MYYKDIPIQALRKSIVHAYLSLDLPYSGSMELSRQQDKMSDAEVMREYDKFEKIAEKKYGQDFRDFKKYYVDKPLVDFIRVKDDYRRRGIATILYKKGHEWMKQRGMKLYASGLQSDQARAAWDSYERKKLVGKEKSKHHGKNIERRFFNT